MDEDNQDGNLLDQADLEKGHLYGMSVHYYLQHLNVVPQNKLKSTQY